MKKHILCMLLVFAMVLGVLPATVAAQEPDVREPAAKVETLDRDDLTFAVRFSVDVEGWTLEEAMASLEKYGNYFADFEVTVNKDVTLASDGTADGYLAGYYEGWVERILAAGGSFVPDAEADGWLKVPFDEAVTLKAGEPMKLMDYAASQYSPGLRQTVREIVNEVKVFDCGIFLTPEYIQANPELEITLTLKIYERSTVAGAHPYGTETVVSTETYKLANHAELADEDIQSIEAVTYNGAEQKPAVVVVHDGTTLEEGKDYTVEYQNNVNAGTATVIVTGTASGLNGYIGTAEATFEIMPKPVIIKADKKTKAYGTADPSLTATVIGAVEGETLNYTLSREAGELPGRYLIIVTPGENPNYEVTAVAGTLAINSVMTPVEDTQKGPFIDVDEKDWFHDEVMDVYENGIMNGVSSNIFDPYGKINRAMVVTTLWRMAGSPEPVKEASFTDVPANQWYSKAVAWAAANDIVRGMGDGTFAPLDNITREQAAAMLNRYADFKGYTVVVKDTDDYIQSAWSEENVNWADTVGLFDDLGVNSINLTKDATRAELAAYLSCFCQNVAK